MNNKHLWWIIPIALIVGGYLGIKLLNGLMDWTAWQLTEQCTIKLAECMNVSYTPINWS